MSALYRTGGEVLRFYRHNQERARDFIDGKISYSTLLSAYNKDRGLLGGAGGIESTQRYSLTKYHTRRLRFVAQRFANQRLDKRMTITRTMDQMLSFAEELVKRHANEIHKSNGLDFLTLARRETMK